MRKGVDFYTVNQVAELLGVSPAAVRNMIYRGNLPARRWGGRLIVLREDLERFLRSLPPAVPGFKIDGKGS